MPFKKHLKGDWYMIRFSKKGWTYANEKTKELIMVQRVGKTKEYTVTKTGPKDTLLNMFQKTKTFNNFHDALKYVGELI